MHAVYQTYIIDEWSETQCEYSHNSYSELKERSGEKSWKRTCIGNVPFYDPTTRNSLLHQKLSVKNSAA